MNRSRQILCRLLCRRLFQRRVLLPHRLTLLILVIAATGIAQQPTEYAPQISEFKNEPSSKTTQPALSKDARYRIGAGDVLDIRIFNRPQLSREAVRVDGRGIIRMPLIEGEIKAACLTEGELAGEIARLYLKYQRNPQVDVFVKEFSSQPVAVIGAVIAPGRFQLQRRVRLLELLSFAGGPTERAGRSIHLVHDGTAPLCEAPSRAESGEIAETGFVSYTLGDTLRGDVNANPFVQPGTVITLPDAEQVFVVGNVLRPSALPLKELTTISRALAMAGGTLPDTKTEQVRIIRQLPGSTTKTEIVVNLKAINKRQAEDVLLQANDIVEVPTASGKRLLRSLVGAIVPSVAQIPVRVIP